MCHCFVFLETGFYSQNGFIAKSGLQLAIHLPQCWSYRCHHAQLSWASFLKHKSLPICVLSVMTLVSFTPVPCVLVYQSRTGSPAHRNVVMINECEAFGLDPWSVPARYWLLSSLLVHSNELNNMFYYDLHF